MSNNVTVNMSLEDRGKTVQKKTQEVQGLNDELQKTTKLASQALSKSPVSIASSATRRNPKYSAYSAGGVSEDIEYNRGRGVMGGTGAAGRDFAKQAKGLGGLVRLYATWAANIFAVSSAFNVLSDAASKSRMIEASEIMSRRVGISMINLAKDIQSTTNYVISLEEALQFGNLGTSAGLAGTQITNLVKIAKGAANVLGRDVTDSIRRIVQGTAKQEQEILDELGIFVKAKDAYEKYAKEFGVKGGADALSAQQKVAAYARAVEEAGSKWKEFAEVEDPFSQFTAKGKEALFSILESANKVFIPILKYLTEAGDSIQALAILIGVKLTQRALPELGTAFREALTFSKFAKESKIEAEFQQLNTKLLESTTQLEKLKTRRDKLLEGIVDPKVALATKSAEDLGGRTGSFQVVSTGIYGTEKKPVPLDKYKSELDVQTAISKALTTQVARAADKEARLAKIVELGLADKTSTVESIVLGQKSKDLAQQEFAEIEKINAAKQKAVALEASIAVQTEKNIVLQRQVSDIQAQRSGSSMISAASSTNIFSTALAKGQVAIAGFKTGLAAASAMSLQFSTAMQGGVIKSFTGFLTTLVKLPAAITAAAVGLTGLARVSAMVGATVAAAGATASAGLSLVLGPIMLAWTAWELFGDKVLRATGLVTEHDDALKAQKQELDKSLVSLSSYLSSIALVNKERERGNLTLDETFGLANREFQIYNNRISLLEENNKKIQERIALEDELKKYGVSGKMGDDGKIDFKTQADAIKFYREKSQAVKDVDKVESDYYKKMASLMTDIMLVENDSSKSSKRKREDIDKITLALGLLELQFIKNKATEAGATQSLQEGLNKSTQRAEELGKEVDKLLNKQIKFPELANIVNRTLNNIAGEMITTVNELDKLPATANTAIQAKVQALQGFAEVAKNAGADIAEYSLILTAINQVSQQIVSRDSTAELRQASITTLNNLVDYLSKLQGNINKGLAASALNVPEGGKKRVELLKYQESETLKILDQASKNEQAAYKRNSAQTLAIFDAKYSAIISKSTELQNQRRDLEDTFAREQIAAIDKELKERAELYTQQYIKLQNILSKNLVLAGKDATLRTNAIDGFNQAVSQLTSNYASNTSALENNRIELENKPEVNKAKEIADLNKELVRLYNNLYQAKEGYKKFWEEEGKRPAEDQQKADFERSIKRLPERERLGRTAEFEENKRFTKLIEDQKEKVLDLQTSLASADFGKDGGLFDALVLEVELAEAQLAKLVQYAPVAAKLASDAAKRNFDLNEIENRLQRFDDFGQNLFTGFGDAIVNFAQTGKFSFKDMVTDMIAELARLEMKMLMTKLYDASGGLGNLLTSAIPSMFGAPASTSSSTYSLTSTPGFNSGGLGLKRAKGGAFDSGLLKFAKGGAFTNQIVNTPTQFKFAQGAGIMGEAGPEAIMPLQRDNRGNLGVRAQGGGTKVDVVVNNYSSEKAEAKEVVDSRGNRRIEVTIGELVAAEVARSNSPVNQSIKNSFATRPNLIRR